MRLKLALALLLLAPAFTHTARAEGGDERHGYGNDRGYDRGYDRDRRGYDREDRERAFRERREFEERERREHYGYRQPPAYYPAARQYAPPVYAPPGVNLFVPFR